MNSVTSCFQSLVPVFIFLIVVETACLGDTIDNLPAVDEQIADVVVGESKYLKAWLWPWAKDSRPSDESRKDSVDDFNRVSIIYGLEKVVLPPKEVIREHLRADNERCQRAKAFCADAMRAVLKPKWLPKGKLEDVLHCVADLEVPSRKVGLVAKADRIIGWYKTDSGEIFLQEDGVTMGIGVILKGDADQSFKEYTANEMLAKVCNLPDGNIVWTRFATEENGICFGTLYGKEKAGNYFGPYSDAELRKQFFTPETKWWQQCSYIFKERFVFISVPVVSQFPGSGSVLPPERF